MAGSVFVRLAKNSKKGQNGTVLVIGGSRRYTGAPHFTARAALRAGADLVYILCKRRALLSLKALHEAIVMPIAYSSRILEKTTACVVGPGLDRTDKPTLQIISKIIDSLGARGIPIVVDADAIHYYKKGLFRHAGTCVVTANYKEKNGLVIKEGHACIYKGEHDLVVAGTKQMRCALHPRENDAGARGIFCLVCSPPRFLYGAMPRCSTRVFLHAN
jgi:NAD(P)H-hydrate repair Nnr-like enzyme with NAD(P)H-hydrate dehydratase domain